IDTAGVGSWDVDIREGRIKSEHGFPLILGTDGSGVVAAAGSRVTRFKRGDRVYAYVFDNRKGGFSAGYACVPAKNVGHLLKSLGLERAGALTVVGLTALQGVDDALALKAGESVIVHGASGNVGMIAVQFAKWRGARVLATASGKDGVAFVRRLGIDDVIDGKKGDVAQAARDLAPEGVDAVLAFAGGEELLRCLDTLHRNGRVAWPNGIEPAPRKRKNLRMQAYDAVASPGKFAALNRAILGSKLDVPVAKAFPLDRAADAHRLIERGHVLGKVVLRPV
ncbi:MAG TPA: NADP-dependent oxidoreductase, partial [Thermoanaerobaculia bacterium]|nr:NADP-dependent oxidoreductase [Thermoanaerobaculia bacterium]